MPNRKKQFFYPGSPQQVSWPVIGLSLGEGVGYVPALKFNDKRNSQYIGQVV